MASIKSVYNWVVTTYRSVMARLARAGDWVFDKIGAGLNWLFRPASNFLVDKYNITAKWLSGLLGWLKNFLVTRYRLISSGVKAILSWLASKLYKVISTIVFVVIKLSDVLPALYKMAQKRVDELILQYEMKLMYSIVTGFLIMCFSVMYFKT